MKQMKKLHLSLKKQWFDMTKAGIKTEDYRELTPYWLKRLMYFDFEDDSDFYTVGDIEEVLLRLSNGDISVLDEKSIYFNHFDSNTMTLGYPKSTDLERILKLEHKGIEIREGNPEWGAVPGRKYFVVLHGAILA